MKITWSDLPSRIDLDDVMECAGDWPMHLSVKETLFFVDATDRLERYIRRASTTAEDALAAMLDAVSSGRERHGAIATAPETLEALSRLLAPTFRDRGFQPPTLTPAQFT